MAGALRERIARLELLARAHPDSRVLLHLAEAHRRAGSLDEARRVLERGLARKPHDAAARILLGRVLLDLGRWSDAQAAFRAALADAPEHMEVVALRALGELAALWRMEGALGAAGQQRPPEAAPPAGGAPARAAPPADRPHASATRAPRAGGAATTPGAAAPPPARPDAPRPRAATVAIGGAPPLEELPWEEMMLVTETLAELYAAQGLTGQAVALYRELLAARPGDPRILDRLHELTGGAGGERAGGARRGAAPAGAPRPPADETPAWTTPETAPGGLEISFLRMVDRQQEPTAAREAAPEAVEAPRPERAGAAADGPGDELAPRIVAQAGEALAGEPDVPLATPEAPPLAEPRLADAGTHEHAQSAALPPSPDAPPAAEVHDDFDWLFAPTSQPPAAGEAGTELLARLVALGDLSLDALEGQRVPAATAARHVRRLARAAAPELGMDPALLAALELAAQLLGIAAPAGAEGGGRALAGGDGARREDAGPAARGEDAGAGADVPSPEDWIGAALARLDTVELPVTVVELLRHAAAVSSTDAAASGAAAVHAPAPRLLAAAVAFRAELARRGRVRVRSLREAASVLWDEADRRYGRDVVAALLGAVAQDPALALPLERRILIVGGDDVEAVSIAQPFRAAGDRIERVRSPGAVRAPRLGADGHAAVVLLGDVSVERATLLVRELRDALGEGRPVVVATGVPDTAGRTALLAAGADLCFGPGASRVEVHAATNALLRRLGELASGQEPRARTGVRPDDSTGSP